MVSTYLIRLVPNLGTVTWRERARAGFGAFVGLFLTAVVTRFVVGSGGPIPLLIAPMGASSVLLFGVPSSPLAQPWSIMGGNLVAAIVGVTCRLMIPDPFAAAAIAVGVSIFIMFVLRCIHPPSGAVAITAVLSGPAVNSLGYGFVIAPVMLNSALLLASALAYNNLTRHRYPHLRPVAGATPEAAKSAAEADLVSFSVADVEAVLAEYDEVIDVDHDDVATILHAAERRAVHRRFGPAAADRHDAKPRPWPSNGASAPRRERERERADN